jgi:hypothetical protein
MNTYAYVRGKPLSYVDPNGLFSLSVGASWSVVNDIPGNHWWGWIPVVGGNRIGLTQGWLAPARCHCKGCGGSWTLSGCSAFLDIRVSIEAGLNAGANLFATRAEAEHVADLKAGAERIRQAGAAAERAQQQRAFSSAVRSLLTVCWCATIVSALTGCERKESGSLSGQISLQYTDSSKSDVSFSLKNGTNGAIYIRGGRTLSLAIEAWDGGFECERIPHTVPEEQPIGFSDGRPSIFKVSPGERVRLVIAATLPKGTRGVSVVLN